MKTKDIKEKDFLNKSTKIEDTHSIKWENIERIGESGGFGIAYKTYKIIDGKRGPTKK